MDIKEAMMRADQKAVLALAGILMQKMGGKMTERDAKAFAWGFEAGRIVEQTAAAGVPGPAMREPRNLGREN